MRITTLRVLGVCMCLGAVLMLLSTFRMDKFLRSTLPGKIHLSARRRVEQLPFAGTAFLSGNYSTNRRLVPPFRGHAFGPPKPKQQSQGVSNAGQEPSESKAATQLLQPEQTPEASGKPEEPAKGSRTEEALFEDQESARAALLAAGIHEAGLPRSRRASLRRPATKQQQRTGAAERRSSLRQTQTPPSYLSGNAGWDYDVEAQAIQARALDLNAIMPGALRNLDSSRMAAAAVRHASGNDMEDNVPASPQCRAYMVSAIEDSVDRELEEREEYYRTLPNLWDPIQAAAVLEAEKPKEVISRADKTVADFPPGSEGMLGRIYTEGLKTQENIRNMGRAFVEGVKAAGLSEEEVEQIWLSVLSPVAAELFIGQMEDWRAWKAEMAQRAAQPLTEAHRVALGMLGAMCGANKECAAELWKVCEQEPQCIHDIWHLRREQGEISELQMGVGLSIAEELERRQAARETPQEEPKKEPEEDASPEQPGQPNSTKTGTGALASHFGNETVVDSSLPAKELNKHVNIAYEAAAETAKSADDSSKKPSEGASDEAPNERPWEKLDGIVAGWAQQREAAMKAAAMKAAAEKEKTAAKEEKAAAEKERAAAEKQEAEALDMSSARHPVIRDSSADDEASTSADHENSTSPDSDTSTSADHENPASPDSDASISADSGTSVAADKDTPISSDSEASATAAH